MQLSKEILERVERIRKYHLASKLTAVADTTVGMPAITGAPLAVPTAPNPFRIFEGYPRVKLPTDLSDVPWATIPILTDGLEALPASAHQPPQDMRTLATWLFMAAGVTSKIVAGAQPTFLRACPSDGLTYPCEIYVAAFAIAGLEPGLYHFSAREFALRKLRDGQETLAHLRRGRPDLDFLKTTPAALLVSTVFCRSSWKFRKRGYRHSIVDAGHQIENLWMAALGLGIQPLVRFTMHAQTGRELIGVNPDAEFRDAEAVQAMIIWAETAERPMVLGTGPTYALGAMPPIERPPLSEMTPSYGSILAVHQDCVAPGVALRDVRPPLTELSPLNNEFSYEKFDSIDRTDASLPMGQLLRTHVPTRAFLPGRLSRGQLQLLNSIAFRWGSAYPLFPDGAHVALVRPFWIIHEVAGIDPGLWYYHPQRDEWSNILFGDFRPASSQMLLGHSPFTEAAAICFLAANLHKLMKEGGPDLYRLAHLEAGAAGQRMNLAASSLDLGCAMTAQFRDDEMRACFVGLERSGWEPLLAVALGLTSHPTSPGRRDLNDSGFWRGGG